MNKNFNLKELLINIFNNQSPVVCLWCFCSVILVYPFLPQNSSIQLSTFLMKLGIGCHLIVLLEIVGKSLFILQEQKGEKEGRSSFKTTYLLVNSIIILGKYILPIISSIIGGVVILSNKTETPFIQDLMFLVILIFIMVTSLCLFLTTFFKK